jgi:heterogeneous nuclear ribonucleoprotein A1/A3
VEIKRTIPKGAIGSKDFRTKKIFVGGIPATVNEGCFFVSFVLILFMTIRVVCILILKGGLCVCCKWADEFKEFFSQFGEVKEHQIMRDHSTSRSRGFGFITFDMEQAVDDLLARGNRLELAGAQVSRALTKLNTYFSFLFVLKDDIPISTTSLCVLCLLARIYITY